MTQPQQQPQQTSEGARSDEPLSEALRYSAERPAEIKLRVQMSVQQSLDNPADIQPPKFRFLVSERSDKGQAAPFSMMFQVAKVPNSDLVTVTIPPLAGMMGPGEHTIRCEGVLEAVVGKRLFEAAVLNLEFYKDPTVTAAVVVSEETTKSGKDTKGSSSSSASSSSAADEDDAMEDVKDILFTIRSKAPTKAVSSSPGTQNEAHVPLPVTTLSTTPNPRSALKEKIKMMILESLQD